MSDEYWFPIGEDIKKQIRRRKMKVLNVLKNKYFGKKTRCV